MALQEGRSGTNPGTTGTVHEVTFEYTGAQRFAHAHGRYTDAVRRGNCFIAHNVAAQAISVALATTYTGLCISNPLGSTKNLEILGAGLALSVAPAAIASIHVIGGSSKTAEVTHTTPLATPGIQNLQLGNTSRSAANADSAATIPTPAYILPLMGGFTAAALPASPAVWYDLGGLIVVRPGAFVCMGALTAVTGFSCFAWEEVPIASSDA